MDVAICSRKLWIDELRGIAMLIVMILHFSNGIEKQWIYSIITAPVMIPLFFSISGFLFNPCLGDDKTFLQKIATRLIFPWVGLAISKAIVIAIIRNSMVYLWEYVLGLFTGANLWYMPCCIIAEILFFYILKISKSEKKLILITIITVLIGGCLKQISVFDFLHINTAMIVQIYILLGYLLRQRESELEFSIQKVFCGALVYVGMLVISFMYYAPQYMDVHKSRYYNFVICILLVFSGVYTLFLVEKKKNRTSKTLVFVGRNTLVFYIFHYDTLFILEKVCEKLSCVIPINWWGMLIKLLWATCICGIISIVINRVCPSLVGRYKVKI